MLVLHGVCTGESHRKGEKLNEDTGEVRKWQMDRWMVFDGRQTLECQLSETYGEPPKVGEVVTAGVIAVSEYMRRPQLTLSAPVDPSVVKAFTPELAAMLMATGLANPEPAHAPSRAAS